MDIRGRKGEFLASILKMPGCEHIHGRLFEFPDVLEHTKQFPKDLDISRQVRNLKKTTKILSFSLNF